MSQASFDQQRLRSLASAAIDGSASQAELMELTELLRDNSAARDEYLTFVDMHALLAGAVSSSISSPEDTTRVPARSVSSRVSAVATLAVCLLVGVIWLLMHGGDSSESADDATAEQQAGEFSSVVQVVDAAWQPAGTRQIGDRLGAELIQLKSGIVRLQFDSGVEVTLEGPAEFELLDEDRTRLTSGLLTAQVPPGAEGFTVVTPSAEVIDLGTSFGVDQREDGVSSVSVFDGEVELLLPDFATKHLLIEGESVRVGADQEIREVEFDPGPFARVWPVSSGIAEATESFEFVPPWPRRLRMLNSDDQIFVAPERYSIRLRDSLDVNISAPGVYVEPGDLTPHQLPRGTMIRSYILHYSPTENRRVRQAERITGSITFDRPVIGLIVQHEELVASMGRFSHRVAGESHHRRQLDLNGAINGDRVILSDDRKTMTLDLFSKGRNTDLVRVIVDGEIRLRPRPRRREVR